MKQYKNYMVYDYYFKSLDSFLKYIEEGSTNTNVFNEWDLSSKEGTYEFTKTNSLDEAIRLCKYGWSDDFDRLLALKADVDKKFLDHDTSIKRVKAEIGFAPSVPDYLKGNPNHMWKLYRVPNWNIIKIYVNICYPAYTSITAIYNRGAIILSIVDALEKAGYAVELITFSCSYFHNEIHLSYFNIKEESSNLNLKRAYFPLCHASFLRRLVFRLMEITPLKEYWQDGNYGRRIEYEELVELMKLDEEQSIIFISPSDMGINGVNIYQDLKSVLKKIRFDRYLKLQ